MFLGNDRTEACIRHTRNCLLGLLILPHGPNMDHEGRFFAHFTSVSCPILVSFHPRFHEGLSHHFRRLQYITHDFWTPWLLTEKITSLIRFFEPTLRQVPQFTNSMNASDTNGDRGT